MKRDVWVYRTEVTNTTSRRMRVVWFEFYYRDEDQWFGVNSRNRPLGNADFVEWYGDDGNILENGWLNPGTSAACDPNWHLAFGEKPYPAKWSFLVVDDSGRESLAEAEVPEEVMMRLCPGGSPL
jgi:hypothetical protein